MAASGNVWEELLWHSAGSKQVELTVILAGEFGCLGLATLRRLAPSNLHAHMHARTSYN